MYGHIYTQGATSAHATHCLLQLVLKLSPSFQGPEIGPYRYRANSKGVGQF